MKSKKIIVGFLFVLIICMCVIIATLFYLTMPKIDSKINNENNFNETKNEEINNTAESGDTNEMAIGSDSSYSEQMNDDIQNMIADEQKELEKVEKEKYNNFKFEASYQNMPGEILEVINQSFDNLEDNLKRCVYDNNLSQGIVARYSYYRTINNGNTLMIYFDLNNEEANQIGIMINLDDYSSQIDIY